MFLRPAEVTDVDTMIALGRRMHAESPRFSLMNFDSDKVRALMVNAIADDRYFLMIAENDERDLIGGFVGFMAQHWFSTDQTAHDIALFVDPDRRGSIVAARLVKSFIDWARGRGAKQINLGISTGVMVEKTAQLYRSLGLKQYGYLFEV